MKVLITGATGFIGSWTVDACLRRNMLVAALTLPDQVQQVLNRWSGHVLPLAGTLADPPWQEIETFEPNACLHAAWITTPGTYLDSPVNRDFYRWSQSLFTDLIQMGISHIVGIGSCAEYTLNAVGGPVSSTARSGDESAYAHWKNALRIDLDNLTRSCMTRWAWARLFYPYGPGESSERLCSAAIRTLNGGNVFELKCPGTRKDYIYIRDAAEGLACILQKGGEGIFDVGTGEAITLKCILEEIAQQIGCLDRLRLGTAMDRLGTLQADPKPLMGLGWKPSVSLQSGIEELIATCR